jgi:hypothetical protein
MGGGFLCFFSDYLAEWNNERGDSSFSGGGDISFGAFPGNAAALWRSQKTV